MMKTMSNNTLTLFCLVEGESVPFPVEIELTRTVGDLKDGIKLKKAPEFDDIAADKLTLLRVSIAFPFLNEDEVQSAINEIKLASDSSEQLFPMDDLSEVFAKAPSKKTIHIIVQPPSTKTSKRRCAYASPSGNKRVATGPSQEESDSEAHSEEDYLDESALAVLRDRIRNELRVKCRYRTDTRIVLVSENASFRRLVQRIQEKFQLDEPLKIMYGNGIEMVSMVDDEDWLLAQDAQTESFGDVVLYCSEQDD